MTTVQQNPEPSGQALPAGTRIEEFVIERVLGSGGFGITYLARDARLNRQVVIKENLPVQFCFRDTHSLTVAPRHSQGEDAENFKWSLENFSKEAAMLASLDHPGIVKVLRSFEAFGTAYFVMPFVEGLALDELSKQRDGTSFSEEELCGLLERMLAALGYLHDRGIYHRDIKPGNILITNDGIPVLIDFGSARQRLSERSMTVVESAGYTPFEQLQSRGDVGPWSDIYALGATLEKILTGDAPPKAMDRMRNDPRVHMTMRREFAGRYSLAMLGSIDKGLEVEGRDRWQEAEEWMATLRGDAIVVTPSSVPVTMDTQLLTSEIPSGKGNALPWITAACLILGVSAWAMISSNRKQESDHGIAGDEVSLQRERGKEDAAKVPDPAGDATPTVARSGSLVLTSEPSGALVKDMEGRGLGETPTELKGLESGKVWQGNVELFGYEPAVIAEEVVAGETRRVPTVKLQPQPQKVIVTSEPAGADVWKDGTLAGTTPYVWENGIPGTIKSYAIKKEGYEDDNVEGTVEIGKSLDLKVTLKPKPVLTSGRQTMASYQKIADDGDAEGMWKLGLCYEEGREVNPNVNVAFYWYHKSAEAGNSEGMFLLGLCYEFGVGTMADRDEALDWYQKASKLGHEGATERVEYAVAPVESDPD
jgi:serine/threonine protein kinase